MEGIFVTNINKLDIIHLVVNKTFEYLNDFCVDPINSLIIWSEYHSKGVIYKSLQDGSNKTIVTDHNIVSPKAISIDYNLI